MLIFIVILIAIILVLLSKKKPIMYMEASRIPKHIWTFWDQDPIPEFIKKCIQTWRDENPGYEITVVSLNTLKDYVGEEETEAILNWKFNNRAQKLSDLVRLSILSKYGGLWLDASIVAYSSFDWVIDDGAECIMFTIPGLESEELILESWFIACTKENEFVTQWNRDFRNIDKYEDVESYVEDIGLTLDGVGSNEYLLVYLPAMKLVKENPNLIKVMDAAAGPYIYHMNGGVSTLCEKKPKTFIKMRKEDRAAVKEAGDEVEACVFDKNVGTIQDVQ
jgi:Capsular polysaccharide synthesis protein